MVNFYFILLCISSCLQGTCIACKIRKKAINVTTNEKRKTAKQKQKVMRCLSWSSARGEKLCEVCVCEGRHCVDLLSETERPGWVSLGPPCSWP